MGFHETVRPWYREETMAAAGFLGFVRPAIRQMFVKDMPYLSKIKGVFENELGYFVVRIVNDEE